MREYEEDFARKIGIGVVMIIPSFVGAGAAWEFFGSWFAVFTWVLIVGTLYGKMVVGKSIPVSSWVAVFVWILVMGMLIGRFFMSKIVPFFS